MAEKQIKVKIVNATYIDGDLAKVKSTHTVGASVARDLIAAGKAVPAGPQTKDEAAGK